MNAGQGVDWMGRIAPLMASQWGLVTTAQAEALGVSRIRLVHLAVAGVVEYIGYDVYGVHDAAMTIDSTYWAAWLSLDPTRTAAERRREPATAGVFSHASAASFYNIGDLRESTAEITVPGPVPEHLAHRKGIELYYESLRPDEVTIVNGLPATTPARTLADLARDWWDMSHVSDIAVDTLVNRAASPDEMAAALEPNAAQFGYASGSAFLEGLLDAVDRGSFQSLWDIADTDTGTALLTAGRLAAIDDILAAAADVDLPTRVRDVIENARATALAEAAELPPVPEGATSGVDLPEIVHAATCPTQINTRAVAEDLTRRIPIWLPYFIWKISPEVWPDRAG